MLGLNYMAWLGLLVWVIVPLFAVLATVLLWRRAGSDPKKALALVAGFAILSAPALVSNGVKAHYDRQVRELCAKDGGVRVYETVRLPAEKFNQWGQINFYKPTQGENTLGTEYIYKWNIRFYEKGEPTVNGPQETSMRRDHIQITRRSDMKLLGEVVMYHRAGGDLPGPWIPSSFHCPDRREANEGILMNQVFIKFTEGDNK